MEIITLIVTVLVIIFATLAVSYTTGFFDDIIDRFVNHNVIDAERDFEEEARIMRLLRKIGYGNHLHFEFQIIRDGERHISGGSGFPQMAIDPFNPWHDPFYTDVVFVHTEAEALDFPDNIIVAWPREYPFTANRINNINRNVNMTPGVTFEDFELSYPITVADLVDNWEKVGDMMVITGTFEWFGSLYNGYTIRSEN